MLLRSETAQEVQRSLERIPKLKCLVGFDGFIDELVEVVNTRESSEKYTVLETISQFGERISRAAGKSTNLEMLPKQKKLGGNGPIMSNALTTFGFDSSYIGCLGYPALDPVFTEFAEKTSVYSVAEPGYTHAAEFNDGKIMLGKYACLDEVNYKNILDRVGNEKFPSIWNQSDFIGVTNWTMLNHMTALWKSILADIYGNQKPDFSRFLFFDLADPEKRTPEDIKECLATVAQFAKYNTVVFGCNEKESMEIAAILQLPEVEESPEGLQKRASAMREKMAVQNVVIHPVKYAVAVNESGTACVDGPFVERPKISTGAGDHFNAGFCLGFVLGLPLEKCLLTGVGTSGFYVRNAASPSANELCDFLNSWEGDAAV